MGFPKMCHLLDPCRNLLFLPCLEKNVVAPGFTKLYYRVSLRYHRLFSSLLIHPFFLVDRPRRGFDFGEACSFGISPGRLDILSRKDDSTIKWLLNCV